MKYLKNVSNRFTVAVTTKEGIVNLGKGEKIDYAKLVNEQEVLNLLNRVPAIVAVGEDKEVKEAPKAVEQCVDTPKEETHAIEPVKAIIEAKEEPEDIAVAEKPVFNTAEPRRFGKKKNRR